MCSSTMIVKHVLLALIYHVPCVPRHPNYFKGSHFQEWKRTYGISPWPSLKYAHILQSQRHSLLSPFNITCRLWLNGDPSHIYQREPISSFTLGQVVVHAAGIIKRSKTTYGRCCKGAGILSLICGLRWRSFLDSFPDRCLLPLRVATNLTFWWVLDLNILPAVTIPYLFASGYLGTELVHTLSFVGVARVY